MARPRGEIRLALAAAAKALCTAQRGATWRELAAHAGVGYQAARITTENMLRAGELLTCGRVRIGCNWANLYAPASSEPDTGTEAHAALAAALSGWAASTKEHP